MPKPPAPQGSTLSDLATFLKDDRVVPVLNYGLLFFMVMTFGFTGVLALIVANFAEDKAPDWIKGHYHFQVRTFWIAIVPILGTLIFYLFVQKNALGGVMPTIAVSLMVICLAYTVGRAVMGFNHLFHKRPYPNPNTLLV